jgi:SHS2 domain-containing protein
MNSGFKIIEHTSDIGIRVWGKTRKELFQEAARDMISLIVDLNGVKIEEERYFQIKAESVEELFLKWLREILYFLDLDGIVFRKFQIEKDNFADSDVKAYFISGLLRGEKINIERHEICTEIKAITRHEFYIKKKGPWWVANILFDV